jgi:hypothetical protein
MVSWMASPAVAGPLCWMCRARCELLTTFGPANPLTCPGRGVNDIPSSASVGPEPLAQPVDFDGCLAHLVTLSVVAFVLRRWFYAAAGVSTVPAADTVLTPVTWHRLAKAA